MTFNTLREKLEIIISYLLITQGLDSAVPEYRLHLMFGMIKRLKETGPLPDIEDEYLRIMTMNEFQIMIDELLEVVIGERSQ